MKTCYKCREVRDLQNFGKYSNSVDGYKPICKKCRKIEYQRNKVYIRGKFLQKKFGISLIEYNKLLDLQNFCCAICGDGIIKNKKALAVDHDHKSGKTRGLLCMNCNLGIGKVNDSIEEILKLIDYMKRHETIDVAIKI